MKYKNILFDLDGTLTDSGEGIINCAILVLEHYGLPVPDRQTLREFVGPPLRDTFIKYGVDPAKMEEAIAVYRSRYTTIGKFENFPYPGIRELLQALTDAGCQLYVATSKPEHMSVEILEKFELAHFFRRICGATLDGSRDSKDLVIAYLLEQAGGVEDAVMIGDTTFDIIGANAHRIPAIGVAWGYGEVADMEAAGATAIARTPAHLLELLSD